MSDSEYDSEDDEDYVPEDTVSEEDIEVGDDEEKSKRKKNKKEQTFKKKRKGGIKLEDDEDEEEEEVSDDEAIDDHCDNLEAKKGKQKEFSKSRENDVWEAFKRDTAVIRHSKMNTNKQESNTQDEKNLKIKSEIIKKVSISPKAVPEKIEITEIYDFAGEEVKVVKSVDASSHKSPSKAMEETEQSSSNSKPNPTRLMKRTLGGLGSVLGKIGKKPKLSTLEKSKLDWHQFKKQEGIEDDLKTSNKDGYLEKQAFLDRVDYKQFEIERDVRQAVRKKN